jgi:hypothetical protein
VVLRCDDDYIAPVEPRAQIPLRAASAAKVSVRAPSAKVPPVKAPSAKAPSAKAPSAKAPSAKAPSAVSDGLGDMFALFDGACDVDLNVINDDTGDSGFDIMPHDDYAGREWDAAEGQYVFSKRHSNDQDNSFGRSTSPRPQATEHRSMPIGLDGNEYEHPGVVVNQYGQLYDPRVPYYNTSGAQRSGQTEQSRHGRARTRYVPASVVSTQPSSHRQPTAGYAPARPPAPARNHPPPRVVQVPQTPVVESTRVVTGADGRPYLEITERHVNASAPIYAPAPQDPPPAAPQIRLEPQVQPAATPQVRFVPQAQPETGSRSYNPPDQGQQIYVDPSTGIQYVLREDAVQQVPAQQLPVQQLPVQQLPVQQLPVRQQQYERQRPHEEPRSRRAQRAESYASSDVEEQQTIDPEYQRFIIFQMSSALEATLDVDHRFIADAVQYMPQLQTTPINKLNFEEMQKLKRNLKRILDRGYWPDGRRFSVAVDSRGSDVRFRRQSSPPRRTASDRTRDGRLAAYDDVGGDMSWMKEFWKKPGSKVEDKPGVDGAKEGSGSLHSSKRDGGQKQSEAGSKKSEAGSRKSDNQMSSVPWGVNNGQDAQGAEANNDWANNGGQQDNQGVEASGDWANNGGGQQDNQGATGDGWGPSKDNAPDDQSSKSITFFDSPDKQNKADNSWNTPEAGDGASPGAKSPPPPAPSSHRSKSSASTNPHAYVQPYFQTWRGNGQTPTAKALHRQPREPYTYLAAPTPHVPASQVGDRSHGVRAGKGADYTHKVRRPKYLDTMEDPYAVFVFNYRSVNKLEEILHQDIKGDLALVAEEVSRGVLMNLPREKLVEELLKSQAKAPEVVVADVPDVQAKAAPRAKSVKSASRGQQNPGGWNDAPAPAPAAQPAADQTAGFQADTGGGGSVKQGKVAAGGGWVQEAEGATGGAWNAGGGQANADNTW